jgi:hypothetical protein
MPLKIEDKRLLIVHSNSGLSSTVDEINFCDDISTYTYGKPDLILQECKVERGNYLLICRDMHEGGALQGVPVVIATSHNTKSAIILQDNKSPDMNRVASKISNLISVFGFTYLAMNKRVAVKS